MTGSSLQGVPMAMESRSSMRFAQTDQELADVLGTRALAQVRANQSFELGAALVGMRDDQRNAGVLLRRAAVPRVVGRREVEAVVRSIAIAVVGDEQHV